MDDSEIIGLYWMRDEGAIRETDAKYGGFCHSLAQNILTIREDAEECVSDTYLQAWNVIPPQKPLHFRAWLGKIVRNLALNLWKKNHRKKRYAGMEAMFDELAECIPSPETVERTMEAADLTAFLNLWLVQLPERERRLFLHRYWYGEPLQQLAKEEGLQPRQLASRMYALRQKLRKALEQEGIAL